MTGFPECFHGIVVLSSWTDGPGLVPASSSRLGMVYVSATSMSTSTLTKFDVSHVGG